MVTAAVISAAGLSSRMGDFKPLMKLGEYTMAEHLIRSFLQAGVTELVIVTGHRAKELEQALSDYPVHFVHNPRYAETQMFDSIKLGFMALSAQAESVFFTPIDVPLFSVRTLHTLTESEFPIVLPSFHGKTGHPILLRRDVIPKLMDYSGNRGLRGAMEESTFPIVRLEVPDEGTVHDADTPEEFETLRSLYQNREHLSAEECEAILNDYAVPPAIRAHCRAVAKRAVQWCTALRCSGVELDEKLIFAAAMLHDICRTEPKHAEAGAALISSLGYPRLSALIRQHHDYSGTQINDAAVLFLADKEVQGSALVSIDERFQKSASKCLSPEAISAHEARYRQVKELALTFRRQCRCEEI